MNNEKSLAEEMAEQDEKLQLAMAVQNTEPEPPEVEISEEPTIDNLEQFFIDEGQWLEEQAKVDERTNKNCPVCSLLPDIFRTLAGALEDTLTNLDILRDDESVNDNITLAMLQRDKAWYLLSKQIVIRLNEEGHAARRVLNAHTRHKKSSGARQIKRDKRKSTRKARRNNRK